MAAISKITSKLSNSITNGCTKAVQVSANKEIKQSGPGYRNDMTRKNKKNTQKNHICQWPHLGKKIDCFILEHGDMNIGRNKGGWGNGVISRAKTSCTFIGIYRGLVPLPGRGTSG